MSKRVPAFTVMVRSLEQRYESLRVENSKIISLGKPYHSLYVTEENLQM